MDRAYFDLETTGLNPWRDEIVLVSFALNNKPVQVEWFEKDRVYSEFRSLMKSKATKVAYNYNFDGLFCKVKGIEIDQSSIFDPYIFWHDVNPHEKCGLKDLAENLLEYKNVKRLEDMEFKPKDYDDLFDDQKVNYVKVGMDNTREWGYVHKNDLVKYAKLDVEYLRELDQMALKRGIPKFISEVEIPLLKIIIDMEARGMRIDKDKAQDLLMDWGEEIQELKAYFDALGVNPNSPKQVGQYLTSSQMKKVYNSGV